MKKNLVISVFSLLIATSLIYVLLTHQKMHCTITSVKDIENLFPKTSKEISDNVSKAKLLITDVVDKIISTPHENLTYKNSFGALDQLQAELEILINPLFVLKELSPDDEVRKEAQNSFLEINNFITDKVSTNNALYSSLKYYAEFNMAKENLSHEQKYLIEDEMDEFQKNGLDLSTDDLEKVRKLKKELDALKLEFQKNIAEDKSYFIVTKEELDGIPTNILNSLEKTEDDKFKIKTDYPTVQAILSFCNVEKTREQMEFLFRNRAYPKNIKILNQIIKKSDELAKLVGFKNFAAMQIDGQMAENPDIVTAFLDDLADKANKKIDSEVKDFLNAADNKKLLDQDGKIKSWNLGYIKNLYKQKFLNIDPKKIAEYLPLENTIKELLDIYEKFFDIKFIELSGTNLWHKDVKLIQVDNNKGKILGYIILDMFPRENKFSHAANAGVIKGKKNSDCPNLSVIMANFPKSTPENPSLLKIRDAVTFFHEFGHAIHELFARTETNHFSGAHVKIDFIELPSQMLENWLLDKEILKKITKHYKTGEPMPDNIIEKIIKLEKFDSADYVLGQICNSQLSLQIFETDSIDTDKLVSQLHQKYEPYLGFPKNTHYQAAFDHLGSDEYGPRYYCYLWSNVYACDLFEKIKEKGLLNPEIGKVYAEKILVPGGSKEPIVLLEEFLGRKPNNEAFLRKMGFV